MRRSESIEGPSVTTWARSGAASLAILLGILAGGCGVMVHKVRFSPTPQFELPDAGTRVVVEVVEESSKEHDIPLGSAAWPYPGHRYVLTGEASFAARLDRDMVSALRAHGYRARAESDTSSGPSDDVVTLTIRPVTRSIDIAIGQTAIEFSGAFVFECVANGKAPPAAWSETIDYAVRKAHFGSLTSRGLARALEAVYWSAVVEIVRRFSTAVSPSS